MEIPDDVQTIINKFNSNGYKAYAVGGCVRDCILGLTPKDWDITTNAVPDDVKKIFNNGAGTGLNDSYTIDTGLKHGTVTVRLNSTNYEVTTFRTESTYSDNRHPDKVFFTENVEDDLSRRDFTINAIAYSPTDGLVDPFGGISDIKNKVIRCVGEPNLRLQEDALRMLRSVRFSATLGFDIDKATLAALSFNKSLIKNISQERIFDELNKLISSPDPYKINVLHDSGILEIILPEFDYCYGVEQNNPHHIYDVAEHTLHVVANIGSRFPTDPKNIKILKWAALFHDCGKPESKSVKNGIDHFKGHAKISADIANTAMKRLKFDNFTANEVKKIILFHSDQREPTPLIVRNYLRQMSPDSLKNLIELKKADSLSKSPDTVNLSIKKIELFEDILEDTLKKGHCYSLSMLAVNGSELIASGFDPGKKIGIVLNYLLDEVIKNPNLNTKDSLIELAGNFSIL